MVKKSFNQQNNGHLSSDPPGYLGREAKSAWRKVVPFLEEQQKVRRIDTGLVEMYVTSYELYRDAYDHVQTNGAVQAIYKYLQDNTGKIIKKTFVGYKKNPMVQTYESASKNMIKIGSELGLSPKSRAELDKLIKTKGNGKTLADVLNEGDDF
ncbi:phage terminase small subunit P27 family [Pediococcus argentinicus]|uniref:phage terminase small subunit P27 family n=1 Tax=Pediococcus argentinicus TaxID=480391 RepID=UPI00338F5881